MTKGGKKNEEKMTLFWKDGHPRVVPFTLAFIEEKKG